MNNIIIESRCLPDRFFSYYYDSSSNLEEEPPVCIIEKIKWNYSHLIIY